MWSEASSLLDLTISSPSPCTYSLTPYKITAQRAYVLDVVESTYEDALTAVFGMPCAKSLHASSGVDPSSIDVASTRARPV